MKMTLGKTARLILALLLVSTLSGCKDKDEARQILPKLDAAFPNSAILKVDNRLLWVQTRVGGISATTAENLYLAVVQQSTMSFGKIQINMQEELNFDGRLYLLVGFAKYYIGWDVRNGVDARGVPRGLLIMDLPRLKEWMVQRIGYWPSTDQILVERIEDVQNTPNGQPMQLPTLAEVKQQEAQQVQDLLRKQEAGQ